MKKTLFIALLVSLCTIACRKQKQPGGMDEKIEIVLAQVISQEDAHPINLIFYAFTERKLDCNTYRIEGDVQVTGNQIVLNMTGLKKSTKGCGEPAQATGYFPVGVLTNGNYTLSIKNGTKEFAGKLTLTDELCSVAYAGGNDVRFRYTEMYNPGKDAIWGEYMYFDEADEVLFQQTEDSLRMHGATPYTGSAGYYSYFNLGADKKIVSRYIGKGVKYRSFIFHYGGDASYPDSLISRMRRDWNDTNATRIYFYTGTGMMYDNRDLGY